MKEFAKKYVSKLPATAWVLVCALCIVGALILPSYAGFVEEFDIPEEDGTPGSSSQYVSKPQPGDTWTEPITGMEFVWVPKGCFQMGQTESEKQYLIEKVGQEKYKKWYADELPRHEVCVDGFWMAKYEVTIGQFKKFIQATGYRTDADKKGKVWVFGKTDGFLFVKGKWEWHEKEGKNWESAVPLGFYGHNDIPVACVSWNDAKAFIGWLNKLSDQRFALPTETQWEYAARGGTSTMRFWGNDDHAIMNANVADKGIYNNHWPFGIEGDDGYMFRAPVGSYPSNPFGLCDMIGNVWEWCEDVYNSRAYAMHSRDNPIITSGSQRHVSRGACWGNAPAFVRSAERGSSESDYADTTLGFRLIRKP